jgi:DNA-binding transcriptional ArsR family regulator
MEELVINTLANPVRLKLLCCLYQSSKNVEELIENCSLAQSAVSQHLIKLRKAGLVKTKRKGRHIYYSLTSNNTGKLANDLYNFSKKLGGELNVKINAKRRAS